MNKRYDTLEKIYNTIMVLKTFQISIVLTFQQNVYSELTHVIQLYVSIYSCDQPFSTKRKFSHLKKYIMPENPFNPSINSFFFVLNK